MSAKHFLAFDLGAESGRTILGTLEKANLKIKELNRFATGMTEIDGHLRWDIHRFLKEMEKGMRVCEAFLMRA